MSKYNLIRNGSLQSLTTSGTGNVGLTWSELELLQDGNLTSSGVTLTSSGILVLEADLSQRIKVDGIRLYADDTSKSSSINFAYKNQESDNYISLTTQSGAYYSTTIPAPSAPRYVKVTVSGINIELYEIQIFNDDYIVGFGINGLEQEKYLQDTPIGEIGDVESISIYNNNADMMPANAYTCVDYTGSDADYYLEIAASENGPFYNLSDGILLEDNDIDSMYTWNMGDFNNTQVSSNKIKRTNLARQPIVFVDIPQIYDSECFNTGQNTWDWDRANKKVYVMGKDSGTLKLWEFKYKTNEWVFLTELNNSGTIKDNMPVMAYCNVSGTGRIYALTNLTDNFGYYDLSGAQNNWTSCANPGWSFTDNNYSRVSMCSDGTRYIYALTSEYASGSNKNFKRFDTVSGTWTSLNSGYDQPYYSASNNTNYSNNTCMAYDYDRDYIYLIEHAEEYSGNRHVQRYIINTDTWNTNYIDIRQIVTTDYVINAVSYHNNWIYVSPCPTWNPVNYFFRYNVVTAEAELVYVGYKHYNPAQGGPGVYCLAIDGPSGSNFGSTVLFGQIDGHRTQILVCNPHYGGTPDNYITPIFDIEDKYKSSYFVIEGIATSGTGSISYDSSVYNGTIQVRSSDTEPLHDRRIFWSTSTHDGYLDEFNLNTGIKTYSLYRRSSSDYVYNIAVNRWNGLIAMVTQRYDSSTSYLSVLRPDNYTTIATPISGFYAGGNNNNYLGMFAANINLEFDIENGLWGYGNAGMSSSLYGRVLFRMQDNYTYTSYRHYNSGHEDFLYDFGIEWNGTGIWYTDKIDNVVKRINYAGTIETTIYDLDSPRAICESADDKGCWVWDWDLASLYKYNKDGTLLKTISASELGLETPEIWRLKKDWDEGMWFINRDGVGHIDDNDKIDLFIYRSELASIKAGHKCCIVYSYGTDSVAFVDLKVGSIVNTWTTGSTASRVPGLMDYSIVDGRYSSDVYNLVPINSDPVWGTNGSLEWKEVRKDGYFLPKHRYHQAKITLQGDAEISKIIMAPAIKTEDIQPKSYRNMYVRTNIPVGADIADYETRLKTWWGVEA